RPPGALVLPPGGADARARVVRRAPGHGRGDRGRRRRAGGKARPGPHRAHPQRLPPPRLSAPNPAPRKADVCGGWHSTHILGCCEELANPPAAVWVGGSRPAMMAARARGVLGVMVA